MPEPWQTSAAGPFTTMKCEHGTVTVEALGEDRFRVVANGGIAADELVVGYDAAEQRSRALAEQLGARSGLR
jgi:hypothetical protein